MTPLTGALISGGASLLGGLLQGKPKTNKAMNSSIRKTNMKNIAKANNQEVAWNKEVQRKAAAAAKVPIVTTRESASEGSVDIAGMMAAAEKSGFNPVTFLNAGGLAAYARTRSSERETVTGSTAMEAALVGLQKPAFNYYEGAVDYSTPPQPATGFGPSLGAALGAGVNTYLASQQQVDQNQFERQNLVMQLVAANARGNGRGYSLGGVPTMRSSAATVSGGSGKYVSADGKTIYVPQGSITNPINIPDDAYKAVFGEGFGPIAKIIFEAPAVWNSGKNKPAMKMVGEQWLQGADDLIGWTGNQVWDAIKKRGWQATKEAILPKAWQNLN